MVEALRRKEAPIRGNAAAVLSAFGPAAKSAVPALTRALADDNPRVRERARDALDRIASTAPTWPAMLPLNCQ